MTLVFVGVLATACAGPSGRGADDSAARRQAEQELARDCRLAAMSRTYDPRCPQPPPEPRRSPGVPSVRLPGGG